MCFLKIVQSSLPIPPISGLTKKRRYSESGNRRWKESYYITKKNPILDLKMGGGIRGGGGERRGDIVGGGTTEETFYYHCV